jgi:hypothetical protein
MAEKAGLCMDADPKNYEYDCGPSTFTGKVASPYIQGVLDEISKKAFPDGKEAFLKERDGNKIT